MELPLLIGAGAAVAAVLLVVVLLLLKGKAKEQPKEADDEHEPAPPAKKGPAQAEKKKEKKFDRSRKTSHSSHPLLAAELKGHTRNVVDIDFDINGKYVITASEGGSVHGQCGLVIVLCGQMLLLYSHLDGGILWCNFLPNTSPFTYTP